MALPERQQRSASWPVRAVVSDGSVRSVTMVLRLAVLGALYCELGRWIIVVWRLVACSRVVMARPTTPDACVC